MQSLTKNKENKSKQHLNDIEMQEEIEELHEV